MSVTLQDVAVPMGVGQGAWSLLCAGHSETLPLDMASLHQGMRDAPSSQLPACTLPTPTTAGE